MFFGVAYVSTIYKLMVRMHERSCELNFQIAIPEEEEKPNLDNSELARFTIERRKKLRNHFMIYIYPASLI